MGIRIGLDIGIASVGWSVVKDDYTVLELGSNLFESADASMNLVRRSMRQQKRLLRRRRTRIQDFKKFWINNSLEIPKTEYNNQLELRNKGLKEKLSPDEICYVLINMLLHRGISYLDDALDEESVGKSDYQKGIAKNRSELQNKYPCEIQYERLKLYGQYRGQVTVVADDEKITLSNVFTTGAYRKEILAFLDKQKEFHTFITEKFVDGYISIFNRKREYYEGPGNELSRTDYGRFTTKIDPATGKYITEENIFEKLIGKCSVYPNEIRAAGASYTAQEFNILNDLNNLTINERKLTREEKEQIIALVKSENTINMRKIIRKVIGEDIYAFQGVRIDKNEKEIFHTFEQYNKMRKELNKIDFSIDTITTEDLDTLGEILTINTEKEAILNAIERSELVLPEEVVECLIALRKKNSSLFSKWQSFSLRIMRELIPEMYEQPKNQMQLLTEMGVFKTNTEKFKGCNKIPRELVTEEIYNPVVCRSVRVAVDIVNALMKKYKALEDKYGELEEIVIEMPRDKNSDDRKQRIKDEQKKNEKELSDIISKLKSEYGIEISEAEFRKYRKLPLKLKLWNEQQGICVYSGRPIDIYELISNENKFEVDHIIPRSISFDDSRNNKVLVYTTENQNKGNNTPYMYLNYISREYDFEQFKSTVQALNLPRNKVKNLLCTDDITKIEVLKGFVSRNINDTRYASRVILNTFQSYFNAKDTNTKIKVIRGSFTHQMRKNMRLKKDREESYAHHAIDATLICYSQMGYEAYRKLQNDFIDFETGEILDENLYNQNMDDETYKNILYAGKWLEIKDKLIEAEKRVKYWHKIDRKINRGLCNQTIRGTRDVDGATYKINKLNIYDQKSFETLKKMIKDGKEDRFLMKRNDPKTFENLLLIMEDYSDAKNAFVEYEKETGDFVRKYSKKHNGARITQLKYLDGEVGSCIDISHKYGYEKGSKKVILESLRPYRTDVYFNSNDKKYYLVGLKYSDFKYVKGQCQIDEDAYAQVLIKEDMISEGETRETLKDKGYIFKFSLYKNEYIEYEKNGEYYTERYLSRTLPNKKNYIETKPIEQPKWNNGKQKLTGLSQTKLIRKIRVDILGKRYFCNEEKFELFVDIK